MPQTSTGDGRHRATAILLAVITAITIGGPLLVGLPDLALQLGSLTLGYSLGFASAVALPERRRALLFVAAGLSVAAFCTTILEIKGSLPAWRIFGESAWSTLLRVFFWFGVAVVAANHSIGRRVRGDRGRG